jgi:hypothetical protein
MDYDFKPLDDGRTAGRSVIETRDNPYIDENDEVDEYQTSNVIRSVVAQSPDTPGQWQAYLEEADLDREISAEEVGSIPPDEWSKLKNTISTHSDPKEARIAASKALRDKEEETDYSRWNEAGFDFGSPQMQADIDNNPIMLLDGFSFDPDMGGDVAQVTAADKMGFFYDGYVREEGAPFSVEEGHRRHVFPRLTKDDMTFDPWETAPNEIPYETGAARPSIEDMTASLKACGGNIVDHASNSGIGLTDALRDALMTEQMKVSQPLAREILTARTIAECNAATKAGIYTDDHYRMSRDNTPEQELRGGIAAFSEALVSAQDKEGLSARGDLIKLKAIEKAALSGSERAQVGAASALLGMITEADRFGISDSKFIRPIARYAVAVTKAPNEHVLARPQDGKKELELSR